MFLKICRRRNASHKYAHFVCIIGIIQPYRYVHNIVWISFNKFSNRRLDVYHQRCLVFTTRLALWRDMIQIPKGGKNLYTFMFTLVILIHIWKKDTCYVPTRTKCDTLLLYCKIVIFINTHCSKTLTTFVVTMSIIQTK